MDTTQHTHVRSLQRGLQLMTAVGENGPVHAKQLALRAGLPLATAYHLLRTLAHDGYVVRLDNGTYVLGDRIGQVLDPRCCGRHTERRLVSSLASRLATTA